jgi:hypothetical protein
VKIIKTKAGEYALVACLVFVVWPTLAGLGLWGLMHAYAAWIWVDIWPPFPTTDFLIASAVVLAAATVLCAWVYRLLAWPPD